MSVSIKQNKSSQNYYHRHDVASIQKLPGIRKVQLCLTTVSTNSKCEFCVQDNKKKKSPLTTCESLKMAAGWKMKSSVSLIADIPVKPSRVSQLP